MTSIKPCILAVALCLGTAAPAEAQPGPTSSAEAQGELFFPVEIEVDVSALPEAGQPPEVSEETGKRLTEALTNSLSNEYRLRVVEQAGSDVAQVVFRLSFVDYMESHYAITIDVKRPDGRRDPAIAYECQPCFDEELIDGALAQVPEFISRLERSVPSSETGNDGDGTDGGKTDGGKIGVRPLMIAGYTTIGVGAGTLVGGIIALTRPLEPIEETPWREVTYRPLGIGLAVGGGAALVVGSVLVVVDAIQCKRRGTCARKRGNPTMSLVPILDSTTAGVGVLRHF
ncbi:MAG: hypothetical protein AAGF11_54665 [Myxococcota bacterium]